ncbi:hypothetical protein FRAAL2175 [Frankia alni ACN14a]|uniref:Uncharacterized protein n=1 Tax=Frankia alni (strain DSM 45986 / CECT 9034 / ACN14a) TaxID=326424 RepID=Q0RNR2_FRAAA|nr:hypothetical protein FRAAL2175 [Frankia alni ACN14a]
MQVTGRSDRPDRPATASARVPDAAAGEGARPGAPGRRDRILVTAIAIIPTPPTVGRLPTVRHPRFSSIRSAHLRCQ